MMKPITGQYECQHRSGVGLDYFTSRIDRLILQANGTCTLVIQSHSRLANAAQSLASGQQVNTNAPETRRTGHYTLQGNIITFFFDDGGQEQGNVGLNGENIQLGTSIFNKVSDSTFLPPTHRLQKDMEDIGKGLKIAGAIGGMAMKAAKTIHETLQSTQENTPASSPGQGTYPPQVPHQQPVPQAQQPAQQPSYPQQSFAPPAAAYTSPPTSYPPPAPSQPAGGEVEALFCDQCGSRVRPGKRFCNNCGARLE